MSRLVIGTNVDMCVMPQDESMSLNSTIVFELFIVYNFSESGMRMFCLYDQGHD